MKKTSLILMIGILLIGVNVYAAGDLVVNGQSSVEGDSVIGGHIAVGDNLLPSTARIANIAGNYDGNGEGYGAYVQANRFPAATGVHQGIGLGGFVLVGPSNWSAGSVAKGLQFVSVSTAGNANVDFYGIDVQGLGTLGDASANDVFGGKLTGVINLSGTNNATANNVYTLYLADSVPSTVTTQYGLFIEKQTQGTSNYGLVLDGEGAGSDIVFGAHTNSVRPRIYTVAGQIWADDALGSHSLISPHDPETGEWIYYSKNLKTGKVVKVNMEKLVKAVEQLTGEKFMSETIEE